MIHRICHIRGYYHIIRNKFECQTDNKTEEPNNRPTKWYSIKPGSTRMVQFTLTQSSNQPVLSVQKAHARVMLAQLNIKGGLK